MGSKKNNGNTGKSYQEMPLSVPQWHPGNPLLGFQTFSTHIHNQAKATLVKDGYHAEMIFFMVQDGSGVIVLPHDNDRDRVAQYLRDRINRDYVYGVLHICESWIRWADGPKDHILTQVIGGEIRVSELKPEHRKEALTVVAQSRDGYAVNWIDEIERAKDNGKETIQFGRSEQHTGFEGRFGKLFG